MDFFARQDDARRRTKKLIVYFVLAVISIIVMVYAVALVPATMIKAQGKGHYSRNYQTEIQLWQPEVLGLVTLGVLAVIFVGSAYKTMELSGGGSAVALSLGGRPVAPDTQDPEERVLMNVVEEMSIASGVPMPAVYILEREQGINAFAAGHSASDAVVAVTRGCLRHLSRDELQGVIGHEFSHILNGDMKLNMRLIGILFGIFCIATIGRILMEVRSGNSRDRNPLPFIGFGLLIVGSMGVFFGRLIQAAVSRQREFLADASALQFTRNPTGLSQALQKIGSFSSTLSSPHASDASHLFFGNGLKSPFFDALATHPPLEQRIKAIDPNWNGEFVESQDLRVEQLFERAKQKPAARPVNRPIPMDERSLAILMGAEGLSAPPMRPQTVIPNLGNPQSQHLRYAEQMRDAMSESLRQASRTPETAMALIYAMLLSGDAELRNRQLLELSGRVPKAVNEALAQLWPEVQTVVLRARLPLVNLTLPALRQMEVGQFTQFGKTLDWLVNSDGETDFFEFILQKIVQRHLAANFSKQRPPSVQYYTLKPLIPDAALILSALAYVGSEDPEAVQKAFATGAPYLRAQDNSGLLLAPRGQCALDRLDEALNRLTLAAPIIKKNLLDACAFVVGADGLIQEAEAELLRAIADTLDCPMPPLGLEAAANEPPRLK